MGTNAPVSGYIFKAYLHTGLPRSHYSINGRHSGFQTKNPNPYCLVECQNVSIPHVVQTEQATQRTNNPHHCPTGRVGFHLMGVLLSPNFPFDHRRSAPPKSVHIMYFTSSLSNRLLSCTFTTTDKFS